METFIAGALFGAVVPCFMTIQLFISGMSKDEKIRHLEVEIACTDKILGCIKKKEF